MLDPEDFPALIFDSTAEPIELIPTLSSEIDRVIYAIAADPMMRALNGLHFESVDGHLRFVTADGFRLATIDTAQHVKGGDLTIQLGTPADIMRLEDGNASHYIMPIRSTEV
jgi:DNA polymerase III sliding clamp (beta) subunit (PCNA family)